MFSWLNFEELLIHNPIELINHSKDTISVAMSKKQYIEFFSNKYTYNGLYYDEEMDFCMFYYADPLQSYKEGDVYAQGYIDVEMKIYRVKWLCNVSINRFNYNFNLLEGAKDFSGEWANSWNWSNDGTYKGLTVKKRTAQWQGIYKIFTAPKDGTYTFSAYVKSSGNNANIFRYVGINGSNAGNVVPNKSMGNNFDWTRDSFSVTLKTGDTIWARYEISGSGSDSILWNAGHKWEEGRTATPYMQSESETTIKWNVTKTEMVVNSKAKTITTVLNGALSKCTRDKDITGWTNETSNRTQDVTQDETQGVLQPDGKYKHTAWAYSPDGTDRFSTIYPRYNLLNQNDFVPGYLSNTGELAPVTTERKEQTSTFLKIDASKSYTLQVFVTLSATESSSWNAVSWFDINQNFIKREAFPEPNVPTAGYYVYRHTVQPPSNAKFVRVSFRKYDDGKLKLEQGSNATPYLPSESETTNVDRPTYMGQYTDYTQEDSTNPSSYKWEKIQPNVNYNYRQPQYSLTLNEDDFVISGYGLRGLKNG